jgi:ribonuclease R
MASHVGATFPGRINGVTRAGLFVTLEDSGADGLIPIGSLPNDFYIHDEAAHCLRGQATGWEYPLGGPVEVLLREANPVSGGLLFELLQGGRQGKPGSGRKRSVSGRSGARQGGRPTTAKTASTVRKVRSRRPKA